MVHAVHVWCMYGACMVHVWCMYGACMVHAVHVMCAHAQVGVHSVPDRRCAHASEDQPHLAASCLVTTSTIFPCARQRVQRYNHAPSNGILHKPAKNLPCFCLKTPMGRLWGLSPLTGRQPGF